MNVQCAELSEWGADVLSLQNTPQEQLSFQVTCAAAKAVSLISVQLGSALCSGKVLE